MKNAKKVPIEMMTMQINISATKKTINKWMANHLQLFRG